MNQEESSRRDTCFQLARSTARFVYEHWLKILLISAALLVPCFWHQHIEACDLGSHTYNAWIAQLIRQGRTPGLWLARRWNNVLFDFALSGLGQFFGWIVAEKIAVSAAVLVFFWGAFSFVCSMARAVRWFVAPFLAIVTYGWVFEMGFMNCYISLGLAFCALAVLIRGRGWDLTALLVLVPLIWLAHPLGLAVFLTIGFYIKISQQLASRHRLYLFLACALLLLAIWTVIRVHFPASAIQWSTDYLHDGFDQLLLFGPQYLVPARLLRAFVWIALLLGIVGGRQASRWWHPYLLPSELYLLTVAGALLFPSWIDSHSLRQAGFLSIGFVTERVTAVSAVLFCCLLASVKPHKWHLAGVSVIAAVFFALLYRDTGVVSRSEDEVERLVLSLPQGQRVLGDPDVFPSTNVGTDHLIDRACVEHCFSYGNYEPMVGEFRVRANPINPFVLANPLRVHVGSRTIYRVHQNDIPSYEIVQCASPASGLCLRNLAQGDGVAMGITHDRGWLAHYRGGSFIFDILLAALLAAVGIALRRMRSGRIDGLPAS